MGFWSSLAGIASTAVGFIPGVGPIASGIMKAGLGIGGALGDSLSGPSSQTGNQASTTLPAYQQDPAVSAAEGYDRTALNGSRSATESMLSPQVSTVLGQYDNAAKTAANLGPRGGGRTAVLAEAPFKKAGAYGEALAGATSSAAKNLGELGTQVGGQKNQYAESQAGINVDQNKTVMAGQQAANKQAAGVGGGIADILTSIINKKPGGGNGPSGSGSTGGSVFGSALDSALGLGGQGSTSSFDA